MSDLALFCADCERPIPYLLVERGGRTVKAWSRDELTPLEREAIDTGAFEVRCFRCGAKERIREGK